MKRCPQCNRVESDDALVYCRADGTALISDSGSISGEAGIAKFGSGAMSSEIETSILPHRTDASINRPKAPSTVLPQTMTLSLELIDSRRRTKIERFEKKNEINLRNRVFYRRYFANSHDSKNV